MRTFLWAAAVLLVLFLLGSYMFIPPVIRIRHSVKVETAEGNVENLLLRKANWKAWWPEKIRGENSTGFAYGNLLFLPGKAGGTSIPAMVKTVSGSFPSRLEYSVTGDKQAEIRWSAEIPATANPFTRISRYRTATKLSDLLEALLRSAGKFLNDDRKVYNLDLNVEKVRDTLVLTTRTALDHPPAPAEYYALIGRLRTVIRQEHKEALDSPMLNVTFMEKKYQVSAGISVNAEIAARNGIYTSKLVPGNILVAKIRGGNGAVASGLQRMKQYMDDHRLISPAIPFQLLLSNRLQEPDSAKWITKIYYPIF